jgi:hypothetical protein
VNLVRLGPRGRLRALVAARRRGADHITGSGPCRPGVRLRPVAGWDGSWRVLSLRVLARRVAAELAAARVGAGPAVLAVDGHSSSGKTTLSARLVELLPGGARVHTDDLAWHQSVFGWDHLFEPGVLAPLRRGEAVAFRPPAWIERGREGAIVVPAGTDPVVLEGVGASRRSRPA